MHKSAAVNMRNTEFVCENLIITPNGDKLIASMKPQKAYARLKSINQFPSRLTSFCFSCNVFDAIYN